MVEVHCPLHDHETETEFLFECAPNNWAQEHSLNVVRCKECGLVFFNPNIDAETRKRYHSKEYYIATGKGCVGYPNYLEDEHVQAKIYFGRLLYSWFNRMWKRKNRRPNSLIDIGCATGHMSLPFYEKGWKVVGIDFSEWATAWGRAHLHMDLRCQDMDKLVLDPEETFDCILFWDSLEHSQNPRRVLRTLHEHSTEDSLIIIQMPNVDKFIDDPKHPFWSLYQHCFHYNLSTLSKLLELEGFRIRRELPSSQPKEMLVIADRVT